MLEADSQSSSSETVRLSARAWGYAEDHSASFFALMHQALRLLYGRANLAEQWQRSDAEDVMAFTSECTAEQLFDFIEASFKLEIARHIFFDENDFVAALNDTFRRDGAPFQVLPGVTREQPVQNYVPDLVRRPVITPEIYWTWSLVWRRSDVRAAVLAVVDGLCDDDGDLGIHGPDAWLPKGDPHRR
jgi:hypothetical protein